MLFQLLVFINWVLSEHRGLFMFGELLQIIFIHFSLSFSFWVNI